MQRIGELKGWVSGFRVRVQLGLGLKVQENSRKRKKKNHSAFRSNNVHLKDCCLPRQAVVLAFSS